MENPIKKLKIKKLYISEKTKDGKPIMSFGRPAKKIAIYVDDYPKALSNFINDARDPQLSWKIGDTVEVLVTVNGDFYNFRLPTRLDRVEIRVSALESLMLDGKNQGESPKHSADISYMDGEITAEDLPF